MAWYNKACFLSLLNQVPEALESLKTFNLRLMLKMPENQLEMRTLEMSELKKVFKRIQEVVVLESIRQGIPHIRFNCMDNVS